MPKFKRLDNAKILIYSHDSFGLGHLRRCRTIANSLTETYKGLTVLIISGSPIIGNFEFKARVDFIRVPGVVKLHNGDYTSLALHVNLEKTLSIRAAIIEHTARIFEPDIFIVDKEPLGLRGEVTDTLAYLRSVGSKNVLGLRDIMDDPVALKAEWARKNSMQSLEDLYDEVWVYGSKSMGSPFDQLDVPESVVKKTQHVGYLPRTSSAANVAIDPDLPEKFILVTVGGGGDGDQVIDYVISAYEMLGEQLLPALIVYGPFMSYELKQKFNERVRQLTHVEAIDFHNNLEHYIEKATGLITMCGYNTFCETLSFNKPSLVIPRETPRKEQLIRAQRAQALGLISMMTHKQAQEITPLAHSIKNFNDWAVPNPQQVDEIMIGLDGINQRVEHLLDED